MSSLETISSNNLPELIWTGGLVPTITNRVQILVDNAGVQYFRKQDPCQRRQLKLLESLELPVPPVIVDIPPDAFASIYCGCPLSEMLNDTSVAPDLLAKAGRVLGRTHLMLAERSPHIDRSLLRTEEAHTAHILKSFRARYIQSTVEPFAVALGQADSSRGKELASLLACMRACSQALVDRAQGPDGTHVIYGDYKPDNIVVDLTHIAGPHLTLIDPHICEGDRRFDVAKFVSRVLLEPQGSKLLPGLYDFVGSYRSIFNEERGSGVSASLRELIAMDSLNVLSSYVLLSLKGDCSFRLVAALGNKDYRSYLIRHLEKLVAGGSHANVFKDSRG